MMRCFTLFAKFYAREFISVEKLPFLKTFRMKLATSKHFTANCHSQMEMPVKQNKTCTVSHNIRSKFVFEIKLFRTYLFQNTQFH